MTIRKDRENKLREIIFYVKSEIDRGNYPSYKDIKQKFSTVGYYKINLILDYMKEEIANGHYPRSSDVGKKFGIKHIWDFVTMKELYKRIGLNPYKSKNHRFREITKS
ncbi:hypothetical protein HYS31_00845 [Candidatus Woesearchaeota archaeon]|nr:hypothetical protein [Candidatus Woesearchaeota archaeon]